MCSQCSVEYKCINTTPNNWNKSGKHKIGLISVWESLGWVSVNICNRCYFMDTHTRTRTFVWLYCVEVCSLFSFRNGLAVSRHTRTLPEMEIPGFLVKSQTGMSPTLLFLHSCQNLHTTSHLFLLHSSHSVVKSRLSYGMYFHFYFCSFSLRACFVL